MDGMSFGYCIESLVLGGPVEGRAGGCTGTARGLVTSVGRVSGCSFFNGSCPLPLFKSTILDGAEESGG